MWLSARMQRPTGETGVPYSIPSRASPGWNREREDSSLTRFLPIRELSCLEQAHCKEWLPESLSAVGKKKQTKGRKLQTWV